MAAIFVYIGVNLEPGLNTTVATITTPTYSSGVAGLNGVKRKNSAIRWRHLMQTVNIGGSLKWLSRHTALAIGKVLETTKRHLFGDGGIVRSQGNKNSELTQRNHDSLCSHRIIVALGSNPHRITHQIRGNLNPTRGMVIAELSRKLNNFWACGETRWCASLWDGGIVRT